MKALALTYRPKTFDDVVEQGAIRRILEYQLETGEHQNCYLFTGGAGTGKTTCARIFANEINKGEGSPIEIDAASNNGVDNIREIINDSKFRSLDSEYKVYIIDECHMLSNGAWNAMLKLIEEPPAKTLFIFCTTDPQKIPATILSRVQRYDFQRISHSSIVDRLIYILDMENEKEKEKIDYTKDALSYLARIADGGMRDAITLLDKCLSFSPIINTENIVEALGIADYHQMIDLTFSILDGKSIEVSKQIEKIHLSGVDLKQFLKQYFSFCLDLYKYSMTGDLVNYTSIPSIYEEQLKELGDEDYKVIRSFIPELIELNNIIKWETSPRALIDAAFIIFTEGD